MRAKNDDDSHVSVDVAVQSQVVLVADASIQTYSGGVFVEVASLLADAADKSNLLMGKSEHWNSSVPFPTSRGANRC